MTILLDDRKYMEVAVEEMKLARSEHQDKEDPLVGAVLVDRYGEIIAQAHRGNFSAGDHAEFTVLEKLRCHKDAAGGTIYATLEPCTKRSDTKKPCAQRIVEEGIARVVIGILDPNPDIFKKGVQYLQHNGIKVDFFDLDLAEEIYHVNNDFIKYWKNKNKNNSNSIRMKEIIESPSGEEERPISNASITDFDHKEIETYLARHDLKYEVPSEEVWEHFIKNKYVVRRNSDLVPTVAGIVLFGSNPNIFLRDHFISAECYVGRLEDGISIEKIRDSQALVNIHGPLSLMIDQSMEFFKKYVSKVPNIKGLKRVDDEFEYPTKVIREVIVNALVHRDYSKGANVHLRMFKDRIVVESPGHILRPNTIEDIQNFVVRSIRRNRAIADEADNMGYMDRKGYGIPTMPAQLAIYGLHPPEFNFDKGYFCVTLFGRELSPIIFRLPDRLRSQLTDRQEEILNCINKHGKINSEKATKLLGVTRDTVNRDFNDLIDLGIILRKGIGRGTYYILSDF